MDRRTFLTATAAGGAMLTAKKVYAKKNAPDYMPIVKARVEGGAYLPYYDEPEVTTPLEICDASGRLKPEARGWARTPIIRPNLSGHWSRKKRWNFWNWICPDYVLSVTCADLDYAAFCAIDFNDFQTDEHVSGIAIKRGGSLGLPEEVERTLTFSGGGIDYHHLNEGGDIKVDLAARLANGKKLGADFVIKKPAGHETLNVIVPWSDDRFQFNSKHNTLGCEGRIDLAGKTYEMSPDSCHGVQDFGRGIWPYESYWNWGVASGVQDGRKIGINVGAKWTTGTGANENALCIDGRLYKIMEDLEWSYEVRDPMKPWRVKSNHSDMIDVTLTPFVARNTKLSLGVISTGGVCSFGRWQGRIRFGGEEVEVRDVVGWAEEFSHRW